MSFRLASSAKQLESYCIAKTCQINSRRTQKERERAYTVGLQRVSQARICFTLSPRCHFCKLLQVASIIILCHPLFMHMRSCFRTIPKDDRAPSIHAFARLVISTTRAL